MPVVCIADTPGFVDHQKGRHAAQPQQVNFLLVLVRDNMTRVSQACKRQVLAGPVTAEGGDIVGPDGQDDRVTRGECREVIPQTREMCAAVGSEKTAQENEDDILTALEIGKPHRLAGGVRQFEIQGESLAGEDRHEEIIRPMGEILVSSASFPLDGSQETVKQIDGLGLLLFGADLRHAVPPLSRVIAKPGVVAALDNLEDRAGRKERGRPFDGISIEDGIIRAIRLQSLEIGAREVVRGIGSQETHALDLVRASGGIPCRHYAPQ